MGRPMSLSVLGVIPCRWASTRLPGKSIADICGKPMLVHVHERASKSKLLSDIVVATDDERIMEVCINNGIAVVRTSSNHKSGTDRMVEVSGMFDADLYVNIQGDLPMVDPDSIDSIISEVNGVDVAAACTKISDCDAILSTNVVKAIVNKKMDAVAFSRLPIPYPKGAPGAYLKHFGIYAMRGAALELFSSNEPGPLELSEGVELYRFIEIGEKVRMVIVSDLGSLSVDTEEDLATARKRIQQ